jgi:hypothetical protein
MGEAALTYSSLTYFSSLAYFSSWFGDKDSNLDSQIQSLASCH